MSLLAAIRDRKHPVLALAPMQDITGLAFWRLLGQFSWPDLLFTEYFRVHPTSRLDPAILRSVTERPESRPVVAQLIGNDPVALVRTARELQAYPVAAIDLNLGCPAPVVYRKCAGGGLLRDRARVERILGALREAVTIPFTVKTRIGFDQADHFDHWLELFASQQLDMLTVHGRTVADGYRPGVRYDLIRQAVRIMKCPVLANGDVDSPAKARWVADETGAAGLMIGRGAIRNPWLFRQIRELLAGQEVFRHTGRDVMEYLEALYEGLRYPAAREESHVKHLKKYMNYFGQGMDPEGRFLHEIRRVQSRREFFTVARRHLDHDLPMSLTPRHATSEVPPLRGESRMCDEAP